MTVLWFPISSHIKNDHEQGRRTVDEVKLGEFTTTTDADGVQYVAASDMTNLLRTVAGLYLTRSRQDTTTDGARTLTNLSEELVRIADTLDVHFITEQGDSHE